MTRDVSAVTRFQASCPRQGWPLRDLSVRPATVGSVMAASVRGKGAAGFRVARWRQWSEAKWWKVARPKVVAVLGEVRRVAAAVVSHRKCRGSLAEGREGG